MSKIIRLNSINLGLVLVLFLSLGFITADMAASLEEPEVGQTLIFNKFNEGFFVGYSKVSATCQAIGENIVVYTEDANVKDIFGEEVNGQFMMYAATTTGLYVSADSGKTWTFLSYVFDLADENEEAEAFGEQFVAVTPGDKVILTGSTKALYWSRDGGKSFRKITRGLPKNVPYYKVLFDISQGTAERKIRKFIATGGGLYYIQDVVARSWKNLNDGMPFVPPNPAPAYDIEIIEDSVLYVASEFGPFKGWINEKGDEFSWEPLIKKSVSFTPQTIDNSDSLTFLLQKDYDGYSLSTASHIYVLDSETGAHWAVNPVEDSLGNLIGMLNEDNLYFTGTFSGDYSTINPENLEMMITSCEKVEEIEFTDDGTIFAASASKVYRITPDGNVMEYTLGEDVADLTIKALLVDGDVLLVGTNKGLYKSELNSINFIKVSPLLSDGYGIDNQDLDINIIKKSISDSYLLGCSIGGLVESSDLNEWVTHNLGLTYRKVSPNAITRIINAFDNSSAYDPNIGIYQRTIDYFGELSNVDNYDKVFLLITDLVDEFFLQAGNGTDYKDGRVDPVDLLSKEENSNSNQREIIYLDDYPTDLEESLEAESAISHYLAELIQLNYDKDEERWLTEGISMWSRWINGYKFYSHDGQSAYLDLTSTLKPKGRTNNLFNWGDAGFDKKEREFSFVFFTYLFEHHLFDSTGVKALIADTTNGMESVENHLKSGTFRQFFTDFAKALYFDALGAEYENGKYYFASIDVEPEKLPIDFGFLTNPPYVFNFSGWSYYYFQVKVWDTNKNSLVAPLIDSVVVFNGDDVTKYEVYLIQQENPDLNENFVISPINLDKYNRGIGQLQVKTSEDDSDSYTTFLLLIISNEPLAQDGGALTLEVDTEVPERTAFYPLQNVVKETYFDFYAFSSERAFIDGGQAKLLGIGSEEEPEIEGPEVLAIGATDTLQFTLSPFLRNEKDIFIYHGFFDIASLLTGNGGTVTLIQRGEDFAGNKYQISRNLQYSKAIAHKKFILNSEDKSFGLVAENGVKENTIVTLYKMDRNDVKIIEPNVQDVVMSDVYILGPVQKKIENARISISYADQNINENDISKLAIYTKTENGWVQVKSYIDRKSKKVFANVDQLGQFRLQKGNIESNSEVLPLSFKLMQNYPNPFNPTTTIVYQLPEDSYVTLTIYNILGQKLKTVVNEFKKAGTYSYKINLEKEIGRQLSSGVYFYTIQAGQFTDTKKMILMK